jgi:hypothetical protein
MGTTDEIPVGVDVCMWRMARMECLNQ